MSVPVNCNFAIYSNTDLSTYDIFCFVKQLVCHSKITDKDKHCYDASHGKTIREKRIKFSHQCNVISSKTVFAPLHKR